MFAIHCHRCQKHYLVGTRAIVEFHNAEHGPQAVVGCPRGHAVLHDFRTDSSRPVHDPSEGSVLAA